MTGGRPLVDSIEAEMLRYKALAEAALAQVEDDALNQTLTAADSCNSLAVIAAHVAGNLRSRFTDFLETDGEKPWRERESEFAGSARTRTEILRHWDAGWAALDSALGPLGDGDLSRQVTIRGVPLSVGEALHRALAHTSSHVGQIVYLAKALRGRDWDCLSIPRGGSASYNLEPTPEKPPQHPAR